MYCKVTMSEAMFESVMQIATLISILWVIVGSIAVVPLLISYFKTKVESEKKKKRKLIFYSLAGWGLLAFVMIFKEIINTLFFITIVPIGGNSWGHI